MLLKYVHPLDDQINPSLPVMLSELSVIMKAIHALDENWKNCFNEQHPKNQATFKRWK